MSRENFPQYRRLLNGKNYYCIESPTEMTEVRVMGKYYSVCKTTASIHPDRMMILDLLNLNAGTSEIIPAAAYNQFLDQCRLNLTEQAL